MGWYGRARGGLYYSRSVYADGRSSKQYIGRGPAAEAAADLDRFGLLEGRAARRSWSVEEGRSGPATALVVELRGWCDLIAAGSLIGAGFHRHHRGEWRRRHG